ncbi:MAG: acetyl-CoA carboxylase biotin carboxyl carrier protein [Chloroflexota bacterium]|nr:acetyl-CoA carboxylase biotin carboxyl carrier protein [Chloroflexota bacterium]
MEPEPITTAEAAAMASDAPAAAESMIAAEPTNGAAAPNAGSPNESLLDLVDRLAALLDRTELTELEVQVGATGLVLRKPSALAPVASVAVPGGAPGAATGFGPGTEASAATPTPAVDAGPPARPAVMAPLTGIWYGAPAPGSAPYVNLGGEVAVGQVIGLIEAMKLFNEIKSDKAGRVAGINAEDGKLVRAKQPLIEVDPL